MRDISRLKLTHVMAVFIFYGAWLVPPNAADVSHIALTSTHFVYNLRREDFFPANHSDIYSPGDPIYFVASTAHWPDLPGWLNFVQQSHMMGGFLYGSPASTEDAADLQVVAVNEATMETKHRYFGIKVVNKGMTAEYFVQLFVMNYNVYEILGLNTILLLRRIKDLWPRGGDVYVAELKSLAQVEGRRPVLWPQGAIPAKEGVYIKIGGTNRFSSTLEDAQDQVQSLDCAGEIIPDSQPSIAVNLEPDFRIDWCKFKLTTQLRNDITTATPQGPIDLEDRPVAWKHVMLPRRDLHLEFMYTVVLALVIAVLVAVVLAYCMFGRREGVYRRNQMTPETQMTQFNSIRRATTNLRLMSDRRQTPQSPFHKDRYSATLPRQSEYQLDSITPEKRAATLPHTGRMRCSIEDDLSKDDLMLMAETPNMVLSRDNPAIY